MITPDDRTAMNRLIVNGQYNAARCIERLLMDGITVVRVIITSLGEERGTRIDILPPYQNNPLWDACGSNRRTDQGLTFFAVRYGCQIVWSLTWAEIELSRIAQAAGGEVH